MQIYLKVDDFASKPVLRSSAGSGGFQDQLVPQASSAASQEMALAVSTISEAFGSATILIAFVSVVETHSTLLSFMHSLWSL